MGNFLTEIERFIDFQAIVDFDIYASDCRIRPASVYETLKILEYWIRTRYAAYVFIKAEADEHKHMD